MSEHADSKKPFTLVQCEPTKGALGLPAWLAHLTPWMDDEGTAAAWPEMIRRYASLARRWSVLDAVAWRRLDFTARKIGVLEARTHVPAGNGALPSIDAVLALLDREIAGDTPSEGEWAAAEAAAAAAAGWAAGGAVDQALRFAENVAFLLRLAAMETAARAPMWKRWPLRRVTVLAERPSFTGGRTDNAAYGFFHWQRSHIGPAEIVPGWSWR